MLVFSLAAAASLAWWLAARAVAGRAPSAGARASAAAPVAWLFVSLFASTAFVYYGYAAWLPDAFTEHGWSDSPRRSSSCS